MMNRFRVDSRRVRELRQGKSGKGPVFYWINRDQRVADNWALLHAQDLALRDKCSLLVVFCLQREYLGAGGRHFLFMLRGLQEMADSLLKNSIGFTVLHGNPGEVLPGLISRLDAHSIVTDFNPLKIKRKWQDQVAEKITIPLYEVDAHNVIPCWYLSDKREYAAYTLRPKVKRLLPEFLLEFPGLQHHPFPPVREVDRIDWEKLCASCQDDSRSGNTAPAPGEVAAGSLLDDFISHRLSDYDLKRNDPLKDGQSRLSPYLHFGQLAPQRAALAVSRSKASEANIASFLEELIVRRELSDNFCYYCPDYDSFDGFPEWAQKTLDEHCHDPREFVYSQDEFLNAETHEPLWNCCQRMLVREGRLHGYLRMYWAKKILEWSESPEEALRIGILLNDMFAFDGRDPNGYTGVAWSIGGVHDRAWPERPVFGKVRYMNESGCRRKFAVKELLECCKERYIL